MPVDLDAVGKAYHGPPLAGSPDDLPARGEALAGRRRVRVRCTTGMGIDGGGSGLGEDGSPVGGAGRPLTFIARPVEPLPLEWFDYPEARRSWWVSADGKTATRERFEYLQEAIHCNLAGYPDRPSPSELAAWILSPGSVPPRPGALCEIFGNTPAGQCAQLLGRRHFSAYEAAFSIIGSGARAPEPIARSHQFAVAPEDGPSEDSTQAVPD